MSMTAQDVKPGQRIRVESGPYAGREGEVARLRHATQLGTNHRIVIIDFVGGGRAVRMITDPVSVLA